MSCRAFGALASVLFIQSAWSADWTLIYKNTDGTKWYAAETFVLQDGSIRTWLKRQNGKKSGEPFAVLVHCARRQVRDYAPGDLGSEFFKPWQAIKPDSVGEIAYDAFCKKSDTSMQIPADPAASTTPAAPSASYAGRVRGKIKPNIVPPAGIEGNPVAEIEIACAPDGTILYRRLVKSSGSKDWDDAALSALAKTEALPIDIDGKVPQRMVISFRPYD